MYHAELKANIPCSKRMSLMMVIDYGLGPLNESCYKAFLEWYVRSSTGNIGKYPTLSTVRQTWRIFHKV